MTSWVIEQDLPEHPLGLSVICRHFSPHLVRVSLVLQDRKPDAIGQNVVNKHLSPQAPRLKVAVNGMLSAMSELCPGSRMSPPPKGKADTQGETTMQMASAVETVNYC